MPCLKLTQSQLNELLAQGAYIEGGPFTTEQACLELCEDLTFDCFPCQEAGMPKHLTFTISGTAAIYVDDNGIGYDTQIFNQTFTVSKFSNVCVWAYGFADSHGRVYCGDSGGGFGGYYAFEWVFQYDFLTARWLLELNGLPGGVIVTYAIDLADFNCRGPNVLTKISGGDCGANYPGFGWPNIITLMAA